MTVHICPRRFASVLLQILCLVVLCTIPCKCKITSLNNKYSQQQWQSLRSVELKDWSPEEPLHGITKRAVGTRQSKLTPSMIRVEKSVLKGTEKSNQAFVHWIGKETSEKVLVLTCQYNITSGLRYVTDSQLWGSEDYGSSFNRIEVEPEAKISYFYTFPSNSQKLLFTDVKAKKIYATMDEMNSFNVSVVPVEPDVVLPHPSEDDKILIYSLSQRKLYVSHNFAHSWSLLSENVLPRFYWGASGHDKDVNIVHMEVEGDTSDTAHYKACISPKCTDVTSQMGFLGPFVADTFLVHKEFMFVEKLNLNGSDRSLMVSYNRQPFKTAYFPGNVKTNDFILLNLDDGQVFVAVSHENSVNLYLSDSTGHFFVLSFSNVYHAIQAYWLEIDLHEVKGMDWTFIANKRVANVPNGVQTYISFDKGGNWGPIPMTKELKKHCQSEDCYLQLNIKRSPMITSAISSTNAPGIIMAHGTLTSANAKQQPVSLFTSRDGGWTWTKAPFDGIQNLNILDQGSILTAIPDGFFATNRSKILHYSCDEGATWKENLFDNSGFLVNGVLSEPGILTLTETMFGHEGVKQPWILIKLNFSLVLQEKCKEEDYESWFPEDYNDVTQNNCTMGKLVEYKRRKQNAKCHNGETLVPKVDTKDNCECTREDYECDFGYEEDEHAKCTMAKWYHEGYLPMECKPGEAYNKSQGYRKVSSDVCEEKNEEKKKYGKVKSPCVVMKPSGLSIVTHGLNPPVGKETTFYLSQSGGSLEDTRYTWDFGDDSRTQAYLGFESARHLKYTFGKSGHFTVKVKAENAKGVASAELMLHVQRQLSDMSMVTPLAGKVGMPVTMSVIVSSHFQLFQESTDHVHFIWTFGDEDAGSRPSLSWDHTVHHTYKQKGTYTVSVEADNSVSSLFRQYKIEIFDDAEILVLEFEGSEIFNISNPVISLLLLQRLRYQLSDDLGLKLERMETTFSPKVPNASLLYIYPSDDPKAESMESIKKRILDLVNSGNFGFSLLGKRTEGGVVIKVTSANPFTPKPDEHKDHHHGSNLKGVFIGAPVLVLAAIFSVGLLCYCRKKHRNAQQYSMLHMQDDSDALLDDEDDPPLDLNIEFRGRDGYQDDPVLDSGGSQLVMQDNVENC